MRDKAGQEIRPLQTGNVVNGSQVSVSTPNGPRTATMIGGTAVINKK